MNISESDIASLRVGNAPIRISPDFSAFGRLRYEEFPKRLAEMRTAAHAPHLIGKVDFTPTYEAFAPDWQTSHRAVPVLAFTEFVPPLADGRNWLALEHQGGGYSCGQTAMIATRFAVFPQIQTLFDKIAGHFHAALNGWFDGPDRDAALTRSYQDMIAAFDLNMPDPARQHLQESIYPVDAGAAPALTDDAGIIGICRSSPVPPVILFLAENSD